MEWRRGRSFAAAVTLFVTTTSAACSALLGTDLTGGSIPPEGGVDGADSGSADGGGADTTSSTDGPFGDGPSLADGGGTPCATAHSFCDDFEHAGVTDRFQSFEANGGTAVIDTNASKSGTRSLLVSIPPTTSPDGPSLRTTFTDPAKKLTLSFWMRREVYGAERYVYIFRLGAEFSDGRGIVVALESEPSKAGLDDIVYFGDGGSEYHQLPTTQFAAAKGQWVHARIEVTFSGPEGPGVAAFADGTLVGTDKLTAFTPQAVPTIITLNVGVIGFTWIGAAGTWSAAFDDVVVDIEK